MRRIRRRNGFVPVAYWAAACSVARSGATGPIRELLDDLRASEQRLDSADGSAPLSP
jgi:hypothetical protein